MSNITSVVFDKCNETKVIYGGLWQYDYGQILRIEGLDLPPAVEIHFSLQETGGEAKRRIGITKSGVTDVVIPDFILEGNDATRNYDAYAFIYLSDEESGETTHKIKMQIKSRSKPEGSSKEEDTSFGAIMDAVNKIAEQNGQGVSDEKIAEAVNAYMEENPVKGTADAVQYISQNLTKEQQTQARTNIGAASAEEFSQLSDTVNDSKQNGSGTVVSNIEPMEDDIPKVFLNGDEFGNMTRDKNEVNMELDYKSKTKSFHAYIKIKWQGSSSLSHAKKNFTIKMYSDDIRDTKQKLAFKDWGTKSHKYVLKANFIDHTHARNVVSARLWSDIVESRNDYENLPEELRTSPNNGAVDGFPIKLYVNGVYQGLYTWNIPKDGWMNNMDDALDTHCMLCGEMNSVTQGENPCMFRSASVIGWTDELHDTMPDNIKTSWTNFITFVMNSTNEEFIANAENYFDVQSVIDYCIFTRVDAGIDNLGKNQMFFTYDGTRWLESVYDLDSTWGSNAYGKLIDGGETLEFQTDYINVTEGGVTNLLYERVENLFMDRLKSRYKELRSGALSVANIINRFERFTDIIGNDLYEEDATVYSIPSATTSNIKQLRNYTVARLEYMDACIDALVVPVLATGISLDKVTATIQGKETLTLAATVTPEDCTEKVYWTSSDTNIATVADGVVTALANGGCTITATVGNYSASCAVTVENIVKKYAVTRTLAGCTSTNDTETANEGEVYTETISANDGYTLDGAAVKVTMGGVDVTASTYNNGVVSIANVTGDIVFSVTAIVSLDATALVYSLPETTTFDGTNTVDTGFKLTENKSFAIVFTLDDYELPTSNASICATGAGHMGFIGIGNNRAISARMFGWSPAIPFNSYSKEAEGGIRKATMVYDSEEGKVTCRMTRNGVDITDTAWGSQSVTYKAWTSTIKIGGASSDVLGFVGTLSDFRIYERAYTESEINAYLGI